MLLFHLILSVFVCIFRSHGTLFLVVYFMCMCLLFRTSHTDYMFLKKFMMHLYRSASNCKENFMFYFGLNLKVVDFSMPFPSYQLQNHIMDILGQEALNPETLPETQLQSSVKMSSLLFFVCFCYVCVFFYLFVLFLFFFCFFAVNFG